MKTLKTGSWIFALMIPFTLMGQGKLVPEDDLYYKRGEENPIVEKKQKEIPKSNTLVVKGAKNIVLTSDERDIDEYNRRSGTADLNEAYLDTTGITDSLYTNENGEYVEGFKGSESDYEYAERIRRFHNPKLTIHITDPAYTQIILLDENDWNVYTDGTYYWDYMRTPYSYYRPYWGGWYGSSWGWGGWYDPWYYNGWYDPWYYGGYYSYGYCGYPYGYYGGYYGGYNHHNWGYSYPGNKRYDNGRRPTSSAYGSRDSRYGGRNYNSTTRSSVGTNSSGYSGGRSSRYTTVPSTRSTDSYNSTGTRSGGRSERYSQPAGSNVRSGSYDRSNSGTYNSGRSVRSSNGGTYTPSSGSRTNYSTGSSDNQVNRSSGNSSRSSNYNSGGNTRSSSSYSTPSYSSPSSSGSSSGGGRSSGSGSSGSSGGGGRSSSGGGGGRR